MKTKRTLLAITILFGITILLSSCHKNIPCPVYADNANAEEVVIES